MPLGGEPFNWQPPGLQVVGGHVGLSEARPYFVYVLSEATVYFVYVLSEARVNLSTCCRTSGQTVGCQVGLLDVRLNCRMPGQTVKR